MELRRHELEALDGRQNRNCRCDDGVAVEERCAGYAECAQQGRAALCDGLAESHESEHAALTLVVGPEQQQHVLHRDDERHAPENQRQDAERRLGGRQPPLRRCRNGLLERIERTRSDVAKDDTSRA